MVSTENIDLNDYDALVLDVQGAELRVLKGAERTLERMRFVQAEVATVEFYECQALLDEVDNFLVERGFRRRKLRPFRYIGTDAWMGDAVWERVSAPMDRESED